MIGIIGAGGIGQAFASHVARAGYEVIVSNSRGPDSLAKHVSELGPHARAGGRRVPFRTLGAGARRAGRLAGLGQQDRDRRHQSSVPRSRGR